MKANNSIIAPANDQSAVWLDETKIFPELMSHLLAEGHHIKFSAPGESMYPTICDGDIITVTPVKTACITTGDIILYCHKSGVAAHRVMRIIERSQKKMRRAFDDSRDGAMGEPHHFILRGDAAVVCDDPVGSDRVLGKVTLVERQGRRIDPYSLKAIICFNARRMAARFKKSFRFQT